LNVWPDTHVEDSTPVDEVAWEVVVRKGVGASPNNVWAYAVCMTTDPSTAIAKAGKPMPAKKKGK
jgi:hypothetical protein